MNAKATLTCYGGAGEIGGNKLLLDTGQTRIMMDFGYSFGRAGIYLSEFMQPRKLNGCLDYIELGLLPDLPGLYRADYCEHTGVRVEDRALVDGVLLTHAHVDHAGMLPLLRQEVPVHMSRESRAVLEAMEATGMQGDFTEFTHSFKLGEARNGGLKKLKGDEVKDRRAVCDTGEVGAKSGIGDAEVLVFPVDHSLPGAQAYILDTPAGAVAYTGDLRMHGYHGERTREFARAAAEHGVDVLICEGTRVTETLAAGEQTVRDRVSSLVADAGRLVVANFPPRDTDRLRTFWDVARQHGRRLAISLKQAYLLDHLPPCEELPTSRDEHIAVYLPRKEWGLWGREDVPEHLQRQEYKLWERDYLDHENIVTARQVRERPGEFIWRCDFFELNELIDVRPPGGSIYIRSVVEPFDEESTFDEKRVKNWLAHFGLPLHQIHASGHAGREDLKWLLDTVRPRRVIPVHTEHPQAFRELHGDVVVPEVGRPIPI